MAFVSTWPHSIPRDFRMTPSHLLLHTAIMAWLFTCAGAQAQELQLFEPVETSGQQSAGNVASPETQAQMAMPTAPAFTLVGTSRISGKRRATLASSTGQIVHVEIQDNESSPIDGFPGYRLVSVDSRRAEITLPAGMPCVGARSQGVSCGMDGNVQLSLTTAAPVPVAEPVAAAVAGGDSSAVAESGDVAGDNPFAAALRAAAENERAGTDGRRGTFNAERFQPRRIAPEDVPPGMRVVRTPFGDRLVEQ